MNAAKDADKFMEKHALRGGREHTHFRLWWVVEHPVIVKAGDKTLKTA